MNRVTLENKSNGKLKSESVGFAWPALLFNCFYLLYRKDWIAFGACFFIDYLISLLPAGWYGFFFLVINVALCFFYNRARLEFLLHHGWSAKAETDDQILFNYNIHTSTNKGMPKDKSITKEVYVDSSNKREETSKKPLTRRWWFWVIVVFVASGIVSEIVSLTDNSGSSENKVEEKKEQTNKEDSDSVDDEDSDEDESALDEDEVNKNIASSLKEDQKYAQKGDDRFAYAKFIKKIRYQEDNTDVFVNANFFSLSEIDKNTVAEKIQGVVGSSIALVDDDYKPSDDQEGYYLGFWYGKRAVGHSKMNYHKYKWYNFD